MCDLCLLEKKTKWHLLTAYFRVVDCLKCQIPMIVLRRHDTELTEAEQRDLDWILEQFPDRSMTDTMGTIKDHWHRHLVQKGE